MRVAVLAPTLGRAHLLTSLVEAFRHTAPDQYVIYFVVDSADGPTRDLTERLAASDDVEQVVCDGTYPVKTNAGYRASQEELVLPTADDIVPREGWYETALKHFEAGARVVGTNDLTPATRDGRHATMPIVRRSYVEDPGAVHGEPGKIFHEGYHHCWVETELWQLACHRGLAVFEPESVIEHRHHGWNTREVDDTDRKGNMQGWGADKALFEKRKAQWLAS